MRFDVGRARLGEFERGGLGRVGVRQRLGRLDDLADLEEAERRLVDVEALHRLTQAERVVVGERVGDDHGRRADGDRPGRGRQGGLAASAATGRRLSPLVSATLFPRCCRHSGPFRERCVGGSTNERRRSCGAARSGMSTMESCAGGARRRLRRPRAGASQGAMPGACPAGPAARAAPAGSGAS